MCRSSAARGVAPDTCMPLPPPRAACRESRPQHLRSWAVAPTRLAPCLGCAWTDFPMHRRHVLGCTHSAPPLLCPIPIPETPTVARRNPVFVPANEREHARLRRALQAPLPTAHPRPPLHLHPCRCIVSHDAAAHVPRRDALHVDRGGRCQGRNGMRRSHQRGVVVAVAVQKVQRLPLASARI